MFLNWNSIFAWLFFSRLEHNLINSFDPIAIDGLSFFVISFSRPMRQTFLERALIRHWPISIIQSTETLFISINILSNVFDTVNVLIGSFTVFSIIFVLTLVKPHRFFSQFTWIYAKIYLRAKTIQFMWMNLRTCTQFCRFSIS